MQSAAFVGSTAFKAPANRYQAMSSSTCPRTGPTFSTPMMMTTAPPKPETLPPLTIPDKIPGPDDPFWKPYKDKPTEPAPGGPNGPGKKAPPKTK